MYKTNKGLYGFLSILLIGVSIALVVLNECKFLILSIPCSIITIILLVIDIKDNRNEETRYNSTLKKLLNSYDAILSEIAEIPDLKKKNIIKITNLLDFIDCQAELRKPIVYKKGEKSTDFLIIDEKEVCIFVLKMNDNITSELEEYLESIKEEKIEKELLDDIEHTTIIKINKDKKLKVSPVKEENDDDIELPMKK